MEIDLQPRKRNENVFRHFIRGYFFHFQSFSVEGILHFSTSKVHTKTIPKVKAILLQRTSITFRQINYPEQH